MQVQNTIYSRTNPENFKGKIDIIPGNLSYEPAKHVRKAYNTLTEMIKDKPYNMYIRQHHRHNTIKLTIQTEDSFIKNKGLKVEGGFNANDDSYVEVAESLIKGYEEKSKKQSSPLRKKIKAGLDLICNKLLEALEIK